MSIFIDDIAAVGTADNIRMEIKKKMIYGLKKTKYMASNIGKNQNKQ